ncbi:probable calcium-binding protein CML36 [Tanacetum coccineum]
MKLPAKINPKHIFRSKKHKTTVTRSNQSSFSSSDSPESSHHRHKANTSGVTTPTSVLPSSDDYSDLQFDLIQAFRFIDTDNDGKITTQELETILNRIVRSEPLIQSDINSELKSMLTEIDSNGDGVITLEEFGAVSEAFGPAVGDGELKQVFEFFDKDGDGKITADELYEVFKSLGDGKVTVEECVGMIKSVDLNGDGFVCFHDFRSMMEQR